LKEEIRLVNAKEPIAHPPFQWVALWLNIYNRSIAFAAIIEITTDFTSRYR